MPPLRLSSPAIPFRRYGHNHLNGKFQLNIQLRTPHGKTGVDVHDYADPSNSPVKFYSSWHDFLSLRLVLSLANGKNDTKPQLAVLPIQDPTECFTFQADHYSDLTLQLDVLPVFGSQSTELVGRAMVLPSSFANLKGTIMSALMNSKLEMLGTVTFQYMVITPLRTPSLPPSVFQLSKSYWRLNPPLRGSLPHEPVKDYVDKQYLKAKSIDGSTSTLAFFTSLESEYIKVQLKILADGSLVVSDDARAVIPLSSGEVLSLPFSSLTYQELCELYTGHTRPFYKLDDLLQRFPLRIGICLFLGQQDENLSFPRLDGVIDALLSYILIFGNSRSFIFSSDVKAVCLMVNLKQPNFPVFIQASPARTAHQDDSLHQSLLFAKSHSLLGIYVPAWLLLEAPVLLDYLRQTGILLFSYGEGSLMQYFQERVDGYEFGSVIYVGNKQDTMFKGCKLSIQNLYSLFANEQASLADAREESALKRSFFKSTNSAPNSLNVVPAKLVKDTSANVLEFLSS